MNRAATAILVVSSFLGGGSTVYSAFQIQLPSRTSLKVTPDAASIWSWHKEVTLPDPGPWLERQCWTVHGPGRRMPDIRLSGQLGARSLGRHGVD